MKDMTNDLDGVSICGTPQERARDFIVALTDPLITVKNVKAGYGLGEAIDCNNCKALIGIVVMMINEQPFAFSIEEAVSLAQSFRDAKRRFPKNPHAENADEIADMLSECAGLAKDLDSEHKSGKKLH